MSQTDFPHPVQITIPNERLAAEYLNVTIDRCPDRNWQFTTNLHRTMRIAPGGDVVPTVAEPFQTLALLQRPDPIADFEIYGLHLPAEIDPADWLDLWLERHNLKTVSSKPIPTQRGVFGDCVCTWETPDGPFAGRFVAMRWGTRFFLITLRTPRHLYPAIADDFFLAAASFAPVQVNEQQLLAEPRHTVAIPSPIPSKTQMPASYALQTDLSDPRISAFSGDQQSIPDLPNDPPFGKLTFILAEPALADHPAKAAALYLNPLMKNPIKIEGDEFVQESAIPAPFSQSWLMVTPATLTPPDAQPISCELRCRVLYHDKAWFIAGVLGPARNIGPIAWMRNKRAFDLASQSLVID
jgi:hypothetical protein